MTLPTGSVRYLVGAAIGIIVAVVAYVAPGFELPDNVAESLTLGVTALLAHHMASGNRQETDAGK